MMEKRLNYLFEREIYDIYLIRHPEVENYKENVFNGSIDVDLSPRGYKQVETLYRYFKERSIKRVFTSPMRRCRAVAERFRNLCEIVVDERLREREFGVFESLDWKTIESLYGKEAQEFLSDPFYYRPKGGESFFDVECRVRGFLEEKLKGLDGSVLIVAHGGVNRVIIMSLLGMKRENVLRISQDYACINHFISDGSFILVRLINGYICGEEL